MTGSNDAPPENDEAIASNRLGMQALAQGDFAAARHHFEAAIAADSAAPALWMNLAAAYRGIADDDGERASLLHALDIDQRYFMANVRLAELHERLGEVPQAAMRWSLVLGLAAQAGKLPPGLEVALAHAEQLVAEHRRAFAAAIDSGLAPSLALVEPGARRRFDACIDALLGRRRVYRNQCAGLHFPFLPADEIFDRRHFPWLERLEAGAGLIHAELAALLAERPAAFHAEGDTSFCFLRRRGSEVDEVGGHCPRTVALLDSLPCPALPRRAPTAFFSVLRPGGRVAPRTGISNARVVVQLPLNAPPGCVLRVGGVSRDLRPSEAIVYDETIEHELRNTADAPAASLVFDVWNPHLTEVERGLLESLFATGDRIGFTASAARFAA